jgi:hypothetical protein
MSSVRSSHLLFLWRGGSRSGNRYCGYSCCIICSVDSCATYLKTQVITVAVTWVKPALAVMIFRVTAFSAILVVPVKAYRWRTFHHPRNGYVAVCTHHHFLCSACYCNLISTITVFRSFEDNIIKWVSCYCSWWWIHGVVVMVTPAA